MKSTLNLAVFLVGLLVAPSTLLLSSAAGETFEIVDTEGEHAEILGPDGKPLLRYMYGRDTSTKESTFDTAKVYAHAIGPDGELLTKGAGGLFPHHRGIFIGWNKLKRGGKSHDLWHVRNTAQLHRAFGDNKTGLEGAAITGKIDWIGVDGDPVIQETRTYAVSKPENCYLQLDFISKLTAVGGDVELNGDPEHAGVQYRPSQKVAENKSAKYHFHADGVDPKKVKDLPWVAQSYQLDDQTWTVQHMNHPDNPKGALWSAYRDYGRFGPFTVVKIAEDESVTLRYRFRIIQGDAPDLDTFAKSYAEFAKL